VFAIERRIRIKRILPTIAAWLSFLLLLLFASLLLT